MVICKQSKAFLLALVFLSVIPLFPSAFATERFVNLGVNSHQTTQKTGDMDIDALTLDDTGVYLGAGFRRAFGQHQQHFLGTGVEFEEILSDTLMGLRAIDYQFQMHKKARIGAFVGAVQLDSGAAQTGYIVGITLSYINLSHGLDLVLDARFMDGLARDRLLATDPTKPPGGRPDIFVDITAIALYLSWRY